MFGFGRRHTRRTIPYGMFDLDRFGIEAKNARVMERIYHKGHAQSWDGKEVLSSLVEEHGVPDLAPDVRRALGRVFAVILWGELAAWKISAELADELEPLEAKMAATSQAFDEARHFYVMYDYLTLIDALPERLDRGAERLLERVMNTNSLAKKLVGMQLMVEPVALTLFHVVKELQIEPVLASLMPYYERDEARHVALGVQYLPSLLKRMSMSQRLGLFAFQFELLTLELISNQGIQRDLELLGLDPRRLVRFGMGKQVKALEMMLATMGKQIDLPTTILSRYAETLSEWLLPNSVWMDATLKERLIRCVQVMRHGVGYSDVELTPDVKDSEVPLMQREQARESPAA